MRHIESITMVSVAALLMACSSKSATAGAGGQGTTATTVGTATTTATGTGGAAPLTSAALVGEWASPTCEAYDNGMGGKNYLTRDFKITTTSWHLDLEIFGDDKCSVGLFSSAIDGPYTLGALSTIVAGATTAEFSFTKIVWTAHTQMMADTFTMSKCGSAAWQVEVPQDVTATGCIGVAQPIAQCPTEYDVVSVQGTDLYFGQRIASLCTLSGRPTALVQYPVVKK
jgi:hypothetical protein